MGAKQRQPDGEAIAAAEAAGLDARFAALTPQEIIVRSVRDGFPGGHRGRRDGAEVADVADAPCAHLDDEVTGLLGRPEDRERQRAASRANRERYVARVRELLVPSPEGVGATR